jgi:hypothetical protein
MNRPEQEFHCPLRPDSKAAQRTPHLIHPKRSAGPLSPGLVLQRPIGGYAVWTLKEFACKPCEFRDLAHTLDKLAAGCPGGTADQPRSRISRTLTAKSRGVNGFCK